jgi:hypothetical protein
VKPHGFHREAEEEYAKAAEDFAAIDWELRFANVLGDLVNPRRDDVGLQLDEARLPKQVRVKKTLTPL